MNITIRIPWHNDGWNGHICSEPEKNTYCVGQHSYPGDLIKVTRRLDWEIKDDVRGKPCGSLETGIPPCSLSINAFGKERMKAKVEPPVWFNPESKPALLDLDESTVCIWPYEQMYGDDVKRELGNGQKYDYDVRLRNTKEYFSQLVEGKSLLFYYANYSNPFSEDDSQKYVLVGISRLKKVGKIQYYEGASEEVKTKYAGGFVWQMPLTSNYPDEGFVIPYHKYRDNPEVLERIALIPDNSRNFKYASRPISEDDSLVLVERLIEISSYLIEIEDTTQNWEERRKWLLNLFSELWKKRGAYPGLPEVLVYLDFQEGLDYYKKQVEAGNDKLAFQQIEQLLDGAIDRVDGLEITTSRMKQIRRNWQLQEGNVPSLLKLLARFNLSVKQIQNIIGRDRTKNSLSATLEDIETNPYIVCEQYVGDDVDDVISFASIDHGIVPNPELGLENIFPNNSAERFRALCVDSLKRETIHSFVSQSKILFSVNNRLSYLPEWKSHQFTDKYFEVDASFISEAVTFRKFEDESYLYLREVRQDEEQIRSVVSELQDRPDIPLRVEISERQFFDLLRVDTSILLEKAPDQYDEALRGQAKVCEKVFTKPVCVISGAAGTGKTTILKSIIKSIEKAHGVGTGIILLAPTGKASERIKEKTQKAASTIHSFLAKGNWLNDNFTLKRIGGKVDATVTTLIIDECSMIDLSLFAALFRSIHWNSVQRLILVGDPNQLPPIGRGKVFSDVIEWMREEHPENLGHLDINVRQLENKATGEGNGILELADIYIQENQRGDNFNKAKQEQILKRVQQGHEIDKDLSVFYWKEMDELETLLESVITQDLKEVIKGKGENEAETLTDIWRQAIRTNSQYPDPTFVQILSPYRGEYFGTDYLNTYFQQLVNGYQATKTQLEGIALYDKVIQIRNRPQSNKISAYSWTDKRNVKLDIYNGEIGFANPHPFDRNHNWAGFALKNFQVKFDRRNEFSVNYGFRKGMFNEPVEENLELGYVISVHKAQGSEFNRVYFILPKKSSPLLSMELLYTAVTRAQVHLTIFAQEDVTTFIELSRPEKSNIRRINSSIFEFKPLPDALFSLTSNWYEEGKVISTLAECFVRSKSEMNIANILHLNDIPFTYEQPKFAGDGSMYLPDFTINWRGDEYYWEHVGRLDLPEYENHWNTKKAWYEKHFPGKLITTFEGPNQTIEIRRIISEIFGVLID